MGNAIGKTNKLETLADFDINIPLHKALRNDQAKTIDGLVATKFKETLGRYTCVGATTGTLTTNGTFSTTATGNLNLYHVKNIVDQLQKWDVEPFPDGNYVGIASVAALRGIKDDTNTGGWIDASRYAGSKRLLTGEVGEYMGVRWIRDTHSMSNSVGNTSIYGEAVVFGQDTVQEAVAIPPEIRVDTPRDFGRDIGVAWYGIAGWQLIWDQYSSANGWYPHIIYVGSA